MMKTAIVRDCNRCGRCCHESPCAAGQLYANSAEGESCKALVFSDGVYGCDLFMHPEQYADTD